MEIKNQCHNGIGCKRTIVVDTLGLSLAIKVTSANVSNNEAGIKALEELKGNVPRLKKSLRTMAINLLLPNISKIILVGRSKLHKHQNLPRDLFLKKIGGMSK